MQLSEHMFGIFERAAAESGGYDVERVILHSDANSFYASVECLYRPEIRDLPVAVCGDPEARHGIVLTKNQIAKNYGIKTGEAIWQARAHCPDLVVVKPNYPLYIAFSRKLRALYEQYTDRVEAFGLDENWLDVSQPGLTIRDGEAIAHVIRNRVREELGITVSVGVSFNKVFAKLGSDLKKPDAVTVISEENFKQIVWKLPVSELIYVGPRTTRKLIDIGILTIGQLANANMDMLRSRFGVNGVMLKAFAMGLDNARVMRVDESEAIKSIGNSTTTPHDIATPEDAKCVIYLLADAVAARLREHHFRSNVTALSVRTTELACFSCQRKLKASSNLSGDVARAAWALFTERYLDKLPLRSLGVSCAGLTPEDAPEQLDMFGVSEKRMRDENLERALDDLRRRFGHQIVRRGVVMFDNAFAQVNPKEDQTIHPVAFLKESGASKYARPDAAGF